MARRKALILAAIVGMVGTAVLLSAVQTRVYAADAQILLQPRRAESPFQTDTPSTPTNSDVTIDTEIEVLKSEPVQAAVADRIGPVPDVSAHRVGKTLIIELRAESKDAKRAATVVNEYAKTYIDMRRAQEAEDVLGAGAQVAVKVRDLQARLDDLDRRIANAPAAQRPTLSAERDTLARQQALFTQRLDELQVEAALKSGGAQLVAAASPPSSPVRPTPVRNVILALVVGTMLGLGVAALLEYLDDRIRSKDDLDRVAAPLSTIGLVPLVQSWNKAGPKVQLVSGSDDDAPAAEAYRALRTSVQLLGVERPVTTLQFTSPTAAEGKTTTLCNLAAVLVEAGPRVAVVDCDLRRPRVHGVFGLPNDVGFTSVLARQVTVDQAIQTVSGYSNLSVLTAGPIPPNPSELLGSKPTSELLFRLQSEFDVVLIDSPPVLPATDATVLSTWVEATVIIAAAALTTRKQLRTAIELLRQAEAPLAGVVLNRARPEERYGYGYRYVEESARTPRRRRRAPAASSGNGHRRGSAAVTGAVRASDVDRPSPVGTPRDEH